MYKDWETSYETLSSMVVPRSTERIHQDSEYGLYTVTVFKKIIDEFKIHAREKKCVHNTIQHSAYSIPKPSSNANGFLIVHTLGLNSCKCKKSGGIN